MIKERNLDPSLKSKIKTDFIPGAAEKFYIVKDGAQSKTYWDARVPGDRIYASPSSGASTALASALAAMTTGRNDVAYLSPDSHTLGAGLTWSKNMCHLIGAFGPAFQNQRPRIGHNANFASLLTVSGQGNTFANLYLQHGRGNATNLNALTVSGNRNSFINCHIAGPLHATEGATAGYDLIRLAAAETYFKDCFIGIDTTAASTISLVEFGAQAEPPRAIFENCIFVMKADGAGAFFLKTLAGLGACAIIFKNCSFFNIGGTALTLGIDGTGLGNGKMFFDINCHFAGVTDIVAAAKESVVFCGHGGYVSADLLNNMIATNPDVS